MNTFSGLWTRQFGEKYPEYKSNFVYYSLQIIKTHIPSFNALVKKKRNIKKRTPYAKEKISLKADVLDQFQEHHILFDNLDGIVKPLVDKSNLHAQQSRREFHTNKQEMRAFLGINYIMFIHKLPRIKNYWECVQFIGNEGIRNVMARLSFEDILRNLHFSDYTKDNKSDKGYKVRSLINHFNQSFSNSVSNDDSQSIDEFLVKFKSLSSMK